MSLRFRTGYERDILSASPSNVGMLVEAYTHKILDHRNRVNIFHPHFQSSYMEVPVGLVPTSRRTQTYRKFSMTVGLSRLILTVRLDQRPKRIEEPSVAVQLLLVLFL